MEFAGELKNDNIDIVILNTAAGSDLKYSIISEGKLLYEKEPYKILVEPNILNEYFDYNSMMKMHKLTKG